MTLKQLLLISAILAVGVVFLAIYALWNAKDQIDYLDLSEQHFQNRLEFEELLGDYSEIVWISETGWILQFCPECTLDEYPEYQNAFYFWDGESLRQVLGPELKSCRESYIGVFRRIQDGVLGLRSVCFLSNDGTSPSGIVTRLFSWDPDLEMFSQLWEFPANLRIGTYSFDEQFERLAVTYVGRTDGGYEVVMHDFKNHESSPIQDLFRAKSPLFVSNSGLVFFGNRRAVDIQTTADLVAWAYRPWSLYQLTSPESEPNKLLGNVQFAGALQDRPNSNMVSFFGTIDSIEGIWLFDLSTYELYRIWPYNNDYSWNPDGSRILVMSEPIEKYEGMRVPTIVELNLNH